MYTQRFVGLVAAMVLAISAITITEVAAQSSAAGSAITVPITGTGSGATFSGVLAIQRFVRSNNQIIAIGTVAGVLTNTATGVTRNVIRQVRVPLDTGASGPLNGICEILSLVLGPLDLNLLGLLVHLDQVVLDLDAQSGPGNLLGNLLCAVTGLLDRVGALQLVTNLLNQILAFLG